LTWGDAVVIHHPMSTDPGPAGTRTPSPALPRPRPSKIAVVDPDRWLDITVVAVLGSISVSAISLAVVVMAWAARSIL